MREGPCVPTSSTYGHLVAVGVGDIDDPDHIGDDDRFTCADA